MRILDCHDRIKKARGDYEAASRAIIALREIAAQRPDRLRGQDLDLAEMRTLDLNHLHAIYFIWMFACFESSLRHFWREGLGRKTVPKTEDLVTSIATRRGVPQDILDSVQEVRIFRNYLVHEDQGDVKPFTIAEASRHLNTYLARLPREW